MHPAIVPKLWQHAETFPRSQMFGLVVLGKAAVRLCASSHRLVVGRRNLVKSELALLRCARSKPATQASYPTCHVLLYGSDKTSSHMIEQLTIRHGSTSTQNCHCSKTSFSSNTQHARINHISLRHWHARGADTGR